MSEISDRRAQLYACFAADPDLDDSAPVAALSVVTRVYDHEPFPKIVTPVALTISLAQTSMTGDDADLTIGFVIRIYSSTKANPRDADVLLDDLIPAVDNLIPDDVPLGNWTKTLELNLDCWLASVVVEFPREDF